MDGAERSGVDKCFGVATSMNAAAIGCDGDAVVKGCRVGLRSRGSGWDSK